MAICHLSPACLPDLPVAYRQSNETPLIACSVVGISVQGEAHRSNVGLKALEVLLQRLIEVAEGGVYERLLIVLVSLLRLLCLEGSPVLQDVLLCDCLRCACTGVTSA